MKTNLQTLTLEMAKKAGLLRARDASAVGVGGSVLTRLVRSGKLVRVGRGVYELPDSEVSEHHSLAEVAAQAPNAVVCLLSALAFHEMTTELPFEVWLAFRRTDRPASFRYHEVRSFRFSEKSFCHGIAIHSIDGIQVQITTPAKTVADCFKFVSKVGLSVAIEALRAYIEEKKGTQSELWKAAKICRVHNVMRPYLEMIQ